MSSLLELSIPYQTLKQFLELDDASTIFKYIGMGVRVYVVGDVGVTTSPTTYTLTPSLGFRMKAYVSIYTSTILNASTRIHIHIHNQFADVGDASAAQNKTCIPCHFSFLFSPVCEQVCT
jgi:hypothetical protein